MIRKFSFWYSSIEEVTLPSSLKIIETQAFADVYLKHIFIPKNVEIIEVLAFGSKYENFVVYVEAEIKPDSWHDGWNIYYGISFPTIFGFVNQGEVNGFRYAVSSINGTNSAIILSSTNTGDIVIPSNIEGYQVKTIGEGAFAEKEINSITIPSGVITIGAHAFSYTPLTLVTIPDSVTTIGHNAFYNTRLSSVTIPNSVTTIGESAFKSTHALTIYVEAAVIPEGWNQNWFYSQNGSVTVIWDYKNQN
jgi:hypothetical protein